MPERYDKDLSSQVGLEEAIRDLAKRLSDNEKKHLDGRDLEALRHLILIETQYPGSLNALARFHTTMQNLGIIGQGLQKVILWFAVGVGFFISAKAGFLAWIAEEIGRR